MARTTTSDGVDQLSPRQAAHLRSRDRKRQTRMVVDNAGVRRILLDRTRRRPSTRQNPPAPPSS